MAAYQAEVVGCSEQPLSSAADQKVEGPNKPSSVQPAGKYLIGVGAAEDTEAERAGKLVTLGKFQESAWKCVAYTALTLFSFRALANVTYWWDMNELWTECSRLPCEFVNPPAMNIAFAVDLAYYTYAIPYCIIVETKRKDFWATFLHHVVTVLLIAYGYGIGFTKAGLLIMALHDVCDPWLELAKMTKYSGMENTTNVLFVIFTAVWIAMRVVYYPAWVIRSILFDAYDAVVAGKAAPEFPHWELFSGMLITLWVLHLFWTYVILKIAAEAVSSGSTEDTREKKTS